MNQKTLRTYKPRLTADEEEVVTKGLRLLLLMYQRSLRAVPEGDWVTLTGLRTEIDKVIGAANSLLLDVDKEEGGEEEKHTQDRPQAV